MMTEQEGAYALSGPSVPPPIVISDVEGIKCDAVETDLPLETGLIPLSMPTSTKLKTNKSNKNSSGTSNISKEKTPNKPKSRVIQSRFRGGLNGSKNNSNSKNGLSGSSSNNSSNSLNCTLGGSLSSSNSSGGRNRNVRGPSTKSGFGKSVCNVSKATGFTGRSTTNLTSNTRPIKSTTNLAETLTTFGGRTRTKAGPAGSLKLHSTVLAERTLLASTHNVFSTTLVGGVVPGRKKLVGSKHDISSAVFPELPDISAIRIDLTSSDKCEDMTILSPVSEKDSSQECSSEIVKEVTYEDHMKEYLRYLQSYYICAVSEDAFDKQVDHLKTQLLFLDQLTSEKQTEVTERKQKLELLDHYQNVSKSYQDQSELLQNLVDALPESEDALDVLTKELEKNLHQVKVDNLHIPENHRMYRDELSEVLESQVDWLSELESLVQLRSHQLTSTISMLDDLQISSQRVQQYEREVNQAARLAIQDASLQIVAQQVD